jgi:hypothetical protein
MAKHVNAYSRFVADPAEPSDILDWFRSQDLVPEERRLEWGVALLYPSLGDVRLAADGSFDGAHSPIVTVLIPRVRRKLLWTVGEVHFLPMPLSQFPELASLRRSFLRWFEDYPLIYDAHPDGPHEFDYYLEGSAMNWGPIRAFPSGMNALTAGRYFVSCRESDGSLSTLCRKLRLRGVVCSEAD